MDRCTYFIRSSACMLACMLCSLMVACDRDNSAESTPAPQVSAELVERTECKGMDPAASSNDTTSCLQFIYAANGDLLVTHINARLNCRMTGTTIDVSVKKHQLTIKEVETYEGSDPCRCLCRYDIQYIITGVTSGRYLVKLDDQYWSGGEPKIDGIVDLNPDGVATICATYPLEPLAFQRPAPQPVE